MNLTEWISLLNAVGTFLVGVAALWGVAVSKRGVKVSTANKAALVMVQTKQDHNTTAISAEIQGVRHDIRNGGGTAIAKAVVEQVVEQIKPVLVENNKIVTTEIARSNAEVAAALAEKHAATWDGVERRVGPAERRGQ